MRHKDFMKRALALAEKGRFGAHPNPMVGAVLVKNGKVIAEGYHRIFGKAHAESSVLRKAGKKAKDATLFLTLEPCSTFGKTPPCVDLIIETGIKKVFIAATDPNPKHRGKGIRKLKRNGIRVHLGLCGDLAKKQNEVFFTWMQKRRPFVAVKLAVSLDGKIATHTGDSKWISSQKSRKYVHQLRAQYDAVMIGSRTCLRDNPKLTVRGVAKQHQEPYKVLLDTELKISRKAALLKGKTHRKVIIFTSKKQGKQKKEKRKWLESNGICVIPVPQAGKRLSLRAILRSLSSFGISSVLVEGGGVLVGSFLDQKLIDKTYFFYAPILIGGSKKTSYVKGRGARLIKNAVKVSQVMVQNVDSDYLVIGYPTYN